MDATPSFAITMISEVPYVILDIQISDRAVGGAGTGQLTSKKCRFFLFATDSTNLPNFG